MKHTRREVLHGSTALVVGATLGQCGGRAPRVPASWAWAGGVTGRRATVKGKLLGAERPYLWVAPLRDARGARELDPANVGPHGVARFELEGLAPDAQYLYALRDRRRGDEVLGRFRTFPEGPASFSFCTASCARTGSNHVVYDVIKKRSPLLFLHLGDMHYENIGEASTDRFARAYQRVLSAPRPAEMFRNQAFAYIWDDHDYGPNNSDRTSRSRVAALQSYLEHAPHYPLTGSPPRTIQQAFTVGRVRFLLTDGRSDRDAEWVRPGKRSMLGAAQKAWLLRELDRAHEYALVVWASAVGWMGDGGEDDWGGFPVERAEIARHIAAKGIENLLMVSGDAHMLAIDDGRHNTVVDGGPGFPIFHCAALDQRGSDKGGEFTHPPVPGGGQFGEVRILDEGGPVQVELTGWNAQEQVVMRHRYRVGARASG